MLFRSGITASASAPAFGPSAVLRFASSLNVVHNTQTASAGAWDRVGTRMAHYLPRAHKSIKFLFNNWYWDNGHATLINPSNALPMTAYAECNGVMRQLTFSSSATVTLAIGDSLIPCDTLTPDMFGFLESEFPANTPLWLTTLFTFADTAQSFVGTNARLAAEYAGQQSWSWNSTATTVDITQPGGMVKTSGTTPTNQSFPFFAFCAGYSSDGSVPVWGMRGYSISRGKGDTANLRDGHGWYQRAMASLALPCGNLGCDGTSATDGLSDNRFLALFALADYWVIEEGANDFQTNGNNVSVATMNTRMQTNKSAIAAKGAKKILASEVMLNLASSDSFTTEANQTKSWVAGGNQDLWNQQLGTLGFDGVIPSQSFRGVDPWKAKVDGVTANYTWSETYHPSSGGHSLKATESIPYFSAASPYAGQPIFSAAPSISGIPAAGRTLHGIDGTTDGTITAEQWYKDGIAIPGATASAYVVQAGDIGGKIAFGNTAIKNGLTVQRISTQVPATAAITAWHTVGVGTNVQVASGDMTLVEPAGVQVGHTVFAAIAYRSNVSFALPSGWTLVSQLSLGDTAGPPGIGSLLLAYCVRGLSAPSYTFARSGGSVADGRTFAFYGPNENPVVDVLSTNTAASNTTTPSLAGLTTTQANQLVLFLLGNGRSSTHSAMSAATDPTGASGATDPAGDPSTTAWTEMIDSAFGTSPTVSLGVFHSMKAAAGATGNFTCTLSAQNRPAMIAAAFK